LNIEFYALSDIGRIRKENQDNYLVIDKGDSGFLCAVFDGVGGCDDGKYASEFLRNTLESIFFRNDMFGKKDVFFQQECIIKAVELLNSKLFEESERRGENLYSTMSILYLYEDLYFIGHVGDSRIYNIRDNTLFRLTKDDNPEMGNSNVLLQAVGTSAEIIPQVYFENIFENDYFLLCTDGLTNHIGEKFILETVCSSKSTDEKVIELIERSLSRGGLDNITAILVKIG
jgi:protein phosphatase